MRILLTLLLGLWIGGSAAAQSDADRAAVQSTIERQLQAFLADDAAAAYSFAAPGIRAMFPTEEIFMEMVRRGYQPVYRPQSYSFGELKAGSGGCSNSSTSSMPAARRGSRSIRWRCSPTERGRSPAASS